jgi:hypothetical protein
MQVAATDLVHDFTDPCLDTTARGIECLNSTLSSQESSTKRRSDCPHNRKPKPRNDSDGPVTGGTRGSGILGMKLKGVRVYD